MSVNRAIIFAHYDRDGLIDPHVRYYLRALRNHARYLVFVSTSAIESELAEIRKGLADVAVTRENVGYDFLSWKHGYGLLQEKSRYDEVLFANDSVYGPLFDIDVVFSNAQSQVFDFWGLAKSHEISPHVQSYFFAFSKALIERGVVDAFWDTVDVIDDKEELIRSYEVGMTEFVQRSAPEIKAQCLFDQKRLGRFEKFRAGIVNGRWRQKSRYQVLKSTLKGRVRNPCHQYWRTMLESNVPFLKVELLRDNPELLELERVRRFVEQSTSYPLALIDNHLNRVARP